MVVGILGWEEVEGKLKNLKREGKEFFFIIKIKKLKGRNFNKKEFSSLQWIKIIE